MHKRVKWRSLVIGGVFALFFMALMFRVYWVQAVEAEELLGKATEMWQESKELLPSRGVVYDRNGNVLAQDAPAYTVAVNPRLIYEEQAKYEVIDLLAPALGLDDYDGRRKLEQLLDRTNDQGERPVHLEVRNEGWKIDYDIAEEIRLAAEEKHIPGIYLIEQPKRYYPSGELAAHVLGYQDKEGQAIIGLEKSYDEILSGDPGFVRYERDLFGYVTPDAKVQYEPAVDGKSVRLTIDANIQLYMEQAMEEVYRKYEPNSMSAIAVDPRTMEILGMVNLPNFDPNIYWNVDDYGDFYNHAIASQYEPGSTFKVVTLAAAIEEGLFHPQETFQSGRIQVPGAPNGISDHNAGVGWGEITYLEGLKRSSNVAFVKLGYEQLGGDRLRHYVEQFGFGQLTGIDLPGEVRGDIDFYRPTEVATASFGHGISVTAIQHVAAMAAIANDGILQKPLIVKEILDSNTGEVLQRFEPEPLRRVISERSAQQVGRYLETVIADQEIGTGRLAFMPEYRVAGKTGTAQKVVNGKYVTDRWDISFVGYAPLEDPRIALYIVIDEPDMDGSYHNAGPIIAPLFKEIMGKSLRYLGVASDTPAAAATAEPDYVIVPDLVGETIVAAENELVRRGLRHELLGYGNRVVQQFPQRQEETIAGNTVYLLTSSPEQVAVPDLSEKSLIDALQICALLEVQCEAEGSGYVREQAIETSGDTRRAQLKLTSGPRMSDETPSHSEQE